MKLFLITQSYLLLFFVHTAHSQTSTIKGRVTDQNTNSPVPFANIIISTISLGAVSDTNGNYIIQNVPPGTYNITCSSVGFKNQTANEIPVTSVKPTVVDFILETNLTLNEVTVTTSPFNKTEESPLSLRTIGSVEINRNPGSNRDISKVIQSFPGVGSSVSFRNDIYVRGGAPNENRFYIDGIEVPNINHFATQGSTGGPVGMINVSFIREVDFYSGAFPANRGNALSSILDFKQITGNQEKFTGTAMLGSSDVGLTLEGFTGKNSNFIVSVRRSYLQLLFKALGLPFLPTYNDMQLTQRIKFKNNNTLSFFGLGAIDDFVLNKSVNEGVTDSALLERNEYLLNNIPVNSQWNYTIGAQYKIFSENGFSTFVVSRNHLYNKSIKFKNNTDDLADLILKYYSAEIENKFRVEKTIYNGAWKWNYGLGYENTLYTNSTFRKIESNGLPVTNAFSSRLNSNNFSVFGQAGNKLFGERLILSLGVRMDFSDYSSSMMNPLNQFSPRFSLTYSLTEKLFLNFNAGRYFQRPPYTVLGYRDSANTLINKYNKITYIECNHLVTGVEYNPTSLSKITIEGFYKKYFKYPFLTKDSISLANLGGDFGVIGNEAATSASDGQSYGIEFFAQQKLNSTFYGIISYTFFRSEFKDKEGKYRSSSWDNRHILNLTAGKKLKKNWEIGIKFRMLGGAPYTPYNISLSSKKEIWDITNQGIFDWDRLNEERFSLSHRLDIRIDKKWFLQKTSLEIYLDIQNVYNFKSEGQPYLNVKRDLQGKPLSNPMDASSYQTYLLTNEEGNVLPSIGLMFEF